MRRKIVTAFLLCVWLAVVVGAVYLALTRREEYGRSGLIVVAIAFFMLVSFALAFLPRSLKKAPASELLSRLTTGGLILCAIAVLVYSIIAGFRNYGVVGNAVLILFAVVFVRIFVDYVKSFGKAKKRSSTKRETSGE